MSANALANSTTPNTTTSTAADREPFTAAEATVLAPQLFVVLEGARPLAGGARFDLSGVGEVRLGRGSDRHAAAIESVSGLRWPVT